MSTFACTHVTLQCPVEASVYSYQPSLGANAFFLAIYSTCACAQLVLGIRFRTWTFMIALILGGLCEGLGYVGRILLALNPWDALGFKIQSECSITYNGITWQCTDCLIVCCLIMGPAFTTAGIYLTFKHFVLAFGQRYSVLAAHLYTWLFISADIFSLILQAAGGAISASAASSNDADTAETGTWIALAGIVFQVVSLLAFATLFALYFFRLFRHRSQLPRQTTDTIHSFSFRLFFAAIILAYMTVLVRCIYRIPELAEGWGNRIMKSETDFIVLDGTMITIATLALTLVHPGFCWSGLSKTTESTPDARAAKDGSEGAVGTDLKSQV